MIGATIVGAVVDGAAEGAGGDEESTDAGPKQIISKQLVFVQQNNSSKVEVNLKFIP